MRLFKFLLTGALCLTIVIVIVVRWNYSPSKNSVSSPNKNSSYSPSERPIPTPQHLALFKEMEDVGFLLLEPDNNRAYIAPGIWLGMDIKQKEDFVAAVAIYCAYQNRADLSYADVFDKMSGKKLGSYSVVWGIKIN